MARYSVTLINHPRRFGKTLNMSMMEQLISKSGDGLFFTFVISNMTNVMKTGKKS